VELKQAECVESEVGVRVLGEGYSAVWLGLYFFTSVAVAFWDNCQAPAGLFARQ